MTQHHPTDAVSRLPWRRLMFFGLLFVGLSALGMYTVYNQFAGRSIEFDSRLATPGMIAAMTGLLLLYFTADGLRLYYTLSALGERIPLRFMLRLVFINIFVSNVTPMATGGGFAQIWYLQRHGVPLGRATAATTIRTVLAIVFIFSLTPVFLMTLRALEGRVLLNDISVALILFITLYLGFFAIVLFRTHWLIAPLSWLLSVLHGFHLVGARRHGRWQFRIRREMLRFARGFGEYLRGPRVSVALSVVFTAVFLLSLFSFPALLMYGLGYDVDYLTTIGLLVVTTFIMYFSPTPGASGISESVFGGFFRDFLTAGHLVLVVIAWRFLTIYLGMIIGLFVFQRELGGRGAPRP